MKRIALENLLACCTVYESGLGARYRYQIIVDLLLSSQLYNFCLTPTFEYILRL